MINNIKALLELTSATNNYVIAQIWDDLDSDNGKYWNSAVGFTGTYAQATKYTLATNAGGDSYSAAIPFTCASPGQYRKLRLIYFNVSDKQLTSEEVVVFNNGTSLESYTLEDLHNFVMQDVSALDTKISGQATIGSLSALNNYGAAKTIDLSATTAYIYPSAVTGALNTYGAATCGYVSAYSSLSSSIASGLSDYNTSKKTDISGQTISGIFNYPSAGDGGLIQAIFNETITKQKYNIANSFGKLTRLNTQQMIAWNGGVVSAGDNWIQFDTDASPINGAYDPASVTILYGTGSGQSRIIFEYIGADRRAYLDRDWKTIPDATSEVVISDAGYIHHVNEGVVRGASANKIQLNTFASTYPSAYIGQMMFFRSGLGADQAKGVIDYDHINQIVTLDSDFSVIPNTSSVYSMEPNISTVAHYSPEGALELFNYTTSSLNSYNVPTCAYIDSYITQMPSYTYFNTLFPTVMSVNFIGGANVQSATFSAYFTSADGSNLPNGTISIAGDNWVVDNNGNLTLGNATVLGTINTDGSFSLCGGWNNFTFGTLRVYNVDQFASDGIITISLNDNLVYNIKTTNQDNFNVYIKSDGALIQPYSVVKTANNISINDLSSTTAYVDTSNITGALDVYGTAKTMDLSSTTAYIYTSAITDGLSSYGAALETTVCALPSIMSAYQSSALVVIEASAIEAIASAASSSIAAYGDDRWSKIYGIPMSDWDVIVG